MASISTDKSGNRRIVFVDASENRRTVYVGRMPMKAAETVKLRIESLVGSALAGSTPEPETARWLKGLDDGLYAKLAAVG